MSTPNPPARDVATAYAEVLHELRTFTRRLSRTWHTISPGVSFVDLTLLRTIAGAETITASDIAVTLQIDKSTASRQLRSLEVRGLLQRSPMPGERRAQALSLTAAGDAALLRTEEANRQALRARLGDWSPEDVERFADLLHRFNRSD